MAKTTVSVPEGHHVEVHAPMGGSGGFSAPPSSAQPGMIPDATASGMQGAMDQALATSPHVKPAPAVKGEQKAEPKPKPKPKKKGVKGGKYEGPDRKKPAKAVGVGDAAAAGDNDSDD